MASLRLSGHSPARLARACMAVLDQQLPLRDAIVLRQAEQLAEQDTPEVRRAWWRVQFALWAQLPDSTFRLWLRPLEAIGAEGTTILVDGPEGIRAWAERRYTALIGEALRRVSDFEAVQFVTAGGER